MLVSSVLLLLIFLDFDIFRKMFDGEDFGLIWILNVNGMSCGSALLFDGASGNGVTFVVCVDAELVTVSPVTMVVITMCLIMVRR